jgi:hypothetical protein
VPFFFGTPQRTLLLLPRSYGLMRQTIRLRWPMVFPRARGLCRLSPVPADGWSFPTLSLHSLRRRLDPYPAVLSGCSCPFLPHRHRPRVTGNTLGATELSLSCNFSREPFFGAAVIRYLQAPTLARPPDCTYRTTRGSGQLGRLHHALPGQLPVPSCGIATCLIKGN